MQKIRNGLLHMGDGQVREQREDEDGARKNCEKQKIGQSGRTGEYAVILNLVPQALCEIDQPPLRGHARSRKAPFRFSSIYCASAICSVPSSASKLAIEPNSVCCFCLGGLPVPEGAGPGRFPPGLRFGFRSQQKVWPQPEPEGAVYTGPCDAVRNTSVVLLRGSIRSSAILFSYGMRRILNLQRPITGGVFQRGLKQRLSCGANQNQAKIGRQGYLRRNGRAIRLRKKCRLSSTVLTQPPQHFDRVVNYMHCRWRSAVFCGIKGLTTAR